MHEREIENLRADDKYVKKNPYVIKKISRQKPNSKRSQRAKIGMDTKWKRTIILNLLIFVYIKNYYIDRCICTTILF